MKLPVAVAAAACLLAAGPSAYAQAQPSQPTEYLQVITVNVRPGAIAEFEDYAKKVVAAAVKIGAPQRIVGYQSLMGAPLGTYMFTTPFNKWEEMDTFAAIPAMLTKAYGEVEGMKILKAGRSAAESVETNVYRTQNDLSTNPRSFDPPMAYVAVTRTELNPDMAPAYRMILGKIKKAEEGSGSALTVMRRTMIEGPGYVTIASRAFNKYGERDAWPNQPELLRKVYGDEEARQMNDTILKAVARRDTWVLAHRPDLSKLAAGAAQ